MGGPVGFQQTGALPPDLPPPPVNSPFDVPPDDPPYNPASRVYANLEFIAWWQKETQVPTLLPVARVAADNGDGGEDHEDFGVRPGGRFTLGYFCAPDQGVGVEATSCSSARIRWTRRSVRTAWATRR
jgi:hypothetical protein